MTEETLQEAVETTEEPTEEPKTYTQEELDKQLQSQVDFRVTQALETQKSKLQAQFQKQLEEEKEKAGMTAEELAQSEFEKEREAFQKEKEAFLKTQLQVKAQESLADNNLPINFSKYVLGDTEEDTDSNIQELKTVWEEALNKSVNERLQTNKPQAGNTSSSVSMTKADFNKLPYTERQALMDKDPKILTKLK